ncbi:VanW family protein [Actinomyces israelii]|uniref:VanW family protein n=1 Tax=Actinomyces israelii TaxID=1659 RepID=A0ABT4IBW3_9ACTO|nr:VanW family protein [Actinomyces israelii]MCZ0858690.1 VanW family protein [Actinomyces israelii]
MTDDVTPPAGTRHNEDAVAAPQTADARISSPEEISHDLSATTPDIACEPHPEDGGAGGVESDDDPTAQADAVEPAEPAGDEDSAPEPAEAEPEAEEAESEEPGPAEDAEAEVSEEPEAPEEEPDGGAPAAESDDAGSVETDADVEAGAVEPAEPAGDEDSAPEPAEAEPEAEEAESEEPGPAEDAEAEVSEEPEAPEEEPDGGAPAAESDDAGSVETDADVEAGAVEPAEPAGGGDSAPGPGEAGGADVESEESEPAEGAEAEVSEEPEAPEEEPDGGAPAAESDDAGSVEVDADTEAESDAVEPAEPAGGGDSAPGPGEAGGADVESEEPGPAEGAEAEVSEEPEAPEEEPDGGAPAAESDDAGSVEADAVEPAEPAGGEGSAPGPGEAGGADVESEEPAGPADAEPEAEKAESEPVDTESGAETPDVESEAGAAETTDVVATPMADTLAAMSARTPAEAASDEASEVETAGSKTAGPEASRPRSFTPAGSEPAEPEVSEPAEGASAAEGPSEAASATAASSALTGIMAVLAKIKAVPTGLPHRRRLNRGVLAGIIGAGLLVLVWGGAAIAATQHVFAGSTVSGVDVGDMSPDEARQVVADQIGAELAQPVTLSANDSTDTLVPADSGVSVDAAASINRLIDPTINPVTLIKRLSGTSVDAVTTVDSDALTNALNARLGTLATGTADAVVTLEGTTPVVTPGTDGTGMDVDASVKALSAGWPLGQEEIAMVEGTARPAITDDDAEAFVDSVLTPLLSDSLTVTAADTSVEKTAATKQVVLSPEQIADLTTVSTDDGELSAVLDSQRLHDAIIDAMGGIETAPTNAGWTIDGSAESAAGAKPQYVAPSPGEGIDMDALTQQLVDAGTTGTASADRTVALTMITTQPEITTPEKDWGITEVTGEFATPFNSEPGRDQNLIRGAEQMNGQIVMPGETFSVEQALGPVDYEHGFTDAGVISNGQHVDALGGGLSQIGTTMFNVGFEAGMDDIEHHPHSYYFDRYPAGREATLWTGQKDVKFANSTPYAALIQAWVADGEVHTRIWSTHYYDVSITSSERYNYRPVQTITRPAGAGCQAYSGGNPGFDITVTRTRTAPDKAMPDDVLTTTYDADNNIACGKSGKS